jgi:DnaJ family protein C protein 7
MNIFKTTKKKTNTNTENDKPPSALDTQATSASRNPSSRSPEKSSSPTKKDKASASSSNLGDKDRSRHSRTDSPQTSPKKSSKPPNPKRNSKYDPKNEHPLNLPPEELRRLSAMSVASEQHPQPSAGGGDPMDTSRDFTSSPPPTSPLSSSAQSMPGGFPQPNGSAPKTNGAAKKEEDAAPRPPPHRTPTSPPPQKNPTAPPPADPVAAEKFKSDGNKFFKAKDYPQAIREYTRGMTNQADGSNMHEI